VEYAKIRHLNVCGPAAMCVTQCVPLACDAVCVCVCLVFGGTLKLVFKGDLLLKRSAPYHPTVYIVSMLLPIITGRLLMIPQRACK
jgi:hypothetical protein